MKSHLLILALALGTLSCTGCGETDEENPEGAGSIPRTEPVPERMSLDPEDIDTFEAAPFSEWAYWHEFRVDRKYLEDVLSNWHRVSADQWENGYSHVAGGDRSGTISLRDGRRIRWMVRPGGLATLSFPDGTLRHLAKELSSMRVDAEPADAADCPPGRR